MFDKTSVFDNIFIVDIMSFIELFFIVFFNLDNGRINKSNFIGSDCYILVGK